jgi:predicted amidophosphoribosyltransferase
VQPRLTEIDELLAGDHHWLSGGEGCYFLREYTSEVGYGFSETNSLINNLKKPLSVRGTPQWKYKGKAIRQVAREFVATIDAEWLETVTLVPMAPSKTPDHEEYDDRMLQVVERMDELHGGGLDVRDLLRQRESVEAASRGGERLRPGQLEALLEIDEAEPSPELVVLVDDVLTTGAHFVAGKRVLQRRFAGVPVVGLFVARRVFPEG